MVKITYIQNYKGNKQGDTEFVSNNIAHGLIEQGVAELASSNTLADVSRDRIMKTDAPIRRGKRGRNIYSTK